jgi:hypothetical protein
MKTIFSMACWIMVCQVFLASCSNPKNDILIDIQDDYLNRQLLLRAPTFFNTFKTADPIVLDLISSSSNDIVFPNDCNLRIFKRTNEGWIEIKEIPTVRLPEGEIVLSPMTKVVEHLDIAPSLIDYTQSYQLRIYAMGDMKTNEGIKKVAASFDVTLNP